MKTTHSCVTQHTTRSVLSSAHSRTRRATLAWLMWAGFAAACSGPAMNAPDGMDPDAAVDDMVAPMDMSMPDAADPDVVRPDDTPAPDDAPGPNDTPGPDDVPMPTDVATMPGCGSLDDPCCMGSNPCGRDLLCMSGICQRCGEMGLSCCAGSTCVEGLDCTSGRCAATPSCGGDGQMCCAGSRCDRGFACRGGMCTTCGDEGEPCCSGSTCNGRLMCGSDSTCIARPMCMRAAEGAPCGDSTTCCAPGTLCGARDGVTNVCLPESCYATEGMRCSRTGPDCCVDGRRCGENYTTDGVCCNPLGGRCGSWTGCCVVPGVMGSVDCEDFRCCLNSGAACTSDGQCCGRRVCMGGTCRLP